jgi:type IV pilus assembly protein PilY1
MSPRIALYRLVALCLGLCLVAGARASLVDIDTSPLATESSTTAVEPNLFFVLDDSGSMMWDYLPDYVTNSYCRSSGAGLSQSNYSGNFSLACCVGNNGGGYVSTNSNACWVGAPSFGTYRAQPLFLTNDFNGVAYNPAITYTPPINADGSSMASQTSANTSGWTNVKNDAYGKQNSYSINLLTQFPDLEWCTDSTYSDCLRNDNYVLPGTVNGKSYTTFHATTASGTGYVATGAPDAATTASRTFGPHYYKITPGEYCDNINLRNCQTSSNSTYKYPATIRWCNSTANATAAAPAAGSCQALQTGTYKYIRYPTRFYTAGTAAVAASPATATFSVSLSSCNNSNKKSVTQVLVNGTNLLNATTSAEKAASNLASDIANGINGRSGATGYTATASSTTVVISAPLSAGNVTYTVSFATSGSSNCVMSVSPATPTFGGYNAGSPAVAAGFYGSFQRVDIVSGQTYTKAATRSDCTSLSNACSYAEEMTNFANWWTYYHTRMQMMKSSAATAFSSISSRYRVGYMSINNNTSSDFLNLGSFTGTQKTNWFSKLRNAYPNNSTPLRTSLAKVGRLYAGKLDGTTLNGSTVVDPMQYSCQKNFTLLSTDGFWNESSNPTQVDGSTAVGDQDGPSVTPAVPRPMLDGNGTANTLADTAYYYYQTDLRNSTLSNCTGSADSGGNTHDVCANNVPPSPNDPLSTQHMATYTLGLGVSGYMQFQSDYTSALTGDFYAVKNGSSASAGNGICTWQADGTACNWPVPVSDTLTAVDDLWHAAVNGRGLYFSARNPADLYSGITTALNDINATIGAAAAATASNPNVSAGDNFVFVSDYVTSEWTGELVAQTIDLQTGNLSSSNLWSAQTQLDNTAYSSRTIYTAPTSSTTTPRVLNWTNLTATEQSYFQTPYISTGSQALTQFCPGGPVCLSSSSQSDASGQKLLNFILGDRSNEGPESNISTYFRQRSHILGDIVNSQAAYVKVPMFDYTDAGYSTYKSGMASRQGVVYVGANDGMLHAINASNGNEMWAYVPTAVLPNLYMLADKEYATKHRYYVDGTPTVADVFFTSDSQWHTVLVGGLGGGGRAYYALDVTDPGNPKTLWEFTDTNLGYTFGKAEIAKLSNGTWAVMFGSGYNNVSPGDGHGRLYVLNAATGALIRTIDTGVGSTSTPSGLVGIRAWVDNADVNNTALRVYGGDNGGNIWRFNVNGDGVHGYDAQLLATLRNASGQVQPVTARPEIGSVPTSSGNVAMVYVGTGRYLGVSDLSDTTVQSLYAIKDPLNTSAWSGWGNPRTATNPSFVQQTLTDTTCPANSSFCTSGQQARTSTSNAVDLRTDAGWYVDLPDSGERANTDPTLVLGTIVFTTNIVTSASVCTAGGSSYINFFDYSSGAPVASTGSGTNTLSGVLLGNAIATQPTLVKLPTNAVESYTRLSNNTTVKVPPPLPPQSSTTRRVQWRELGTKQ